MTVVDTTPPVLDVTDPTVVEASGPGGAVVSFPVTAHDLVDGERGRRLRARALDRLRARPDSGALLGADSRGNPDTVGFIVSVVDTRGSRT